MSVSVLQVGPWEATMAAFTIFSPNILALIQQPKWSLWKRRLTLILFHLTTAAIYLGASGKLDFSNWTVTFSALYSLGLLSYIGIWKPTADKLEIKSSNLLFPDQPTTKKEFSLRTPTRDVMENSLINND